MLNFGTYTNNTLFIKVTRCVFAYICNLTGEFFFTTLGVANLLFEFCDMDRCINIILHNLFTDDNGILKVVPSPRHKCYYQVTAQCKLTFLSGTAICDRVAFFHFISNVYNRPLIDSGILVTSLKLLKLVRFNSAVEIAILFKFGPYVANSDFIATYKDNFTISFGADYSPGIFCSALLEAGSNNRRVRSEKRHSLSLHVRAH